MINCLLAITWLPLVTATGPQEKFNLPAGHYTLEQLASKLTQSGLPTKAAPECKSEIYACFSANLGPQEYIRAISGSRRLQVTQENGSFLIQSSPENQQSEETLLNRYETALSNRLAETYATAIQKTKYIMGLPASKRQSEIDKILSDASKINLQTQPTVSSASTNLLASYFAEETTYSSIAIPNALLSTPSSKLFNFGKPWQFSTLLNSLPLFTTNGNDLSEINWSELKINLPKNTQGNNFQDPLQTQLRQAIAPIRFATKIETEPLTAVSSCWLVLHNLNQPNIFVQTPIPLTSVGTVTTRDLFSNQSFASYQARCQLTSQFIKSHPDPIRISQNLPTTPISSAFLRLATNQNRPIFAYVSPLSNFEVPASWQDSWKHLLTQVNSADFIPSLPNHSTSSIFGTKTQNSARLAAELPNVFNVTESDNVITIENELSFLDTLVDSSTHIPTLILSEPRTFNQIIDQVQQLKLDPTSNQIFSTIISHFCHPNELKPLAKLIKSSPKIQNKLQKLQSEQEIALNLAEVEPAAVNEFLKEFAKQSTRLLKSEAEVPVGIIAKVILDRKKLNELSLVISSKETYQNVHSVQLKIQTNALVLLSTTVDNVSLT